MSFASVSRSSCTFFPGAFLESLVYMEAIFVFGFWAVGWLLDGKELYLYVVFFVWLWIVLNLH